MSELKQTNDLLDAIAKVLLRCFVLGYALLLIWAGVFFACRRSYLPAQRPAVWFDAAQNEPDALLWHRAGEMLRISLLSPAVHSDQTGLANAEGVTTQNANGSNIVVLPRHMVLNPPMP